MAEDDGLATGERTATEDSVLPDAVGSTHAVTLSSEEPLAVDTAAMTADETVERRDDRHDRDWVCVARHKRCFDRDHRDDHDDDRDHDRDGHRDFSAVDGSELVAVAGSDFGNIGDTAHRDGDHDDCDRRRDCRSRFYIAAGDRRREARRRAMDRCEDRHHHGSRRCRIVVCKHLH